MPMTCRPDQLNAVGQQPDVLIARDVVRRFGDVLAVSDVSVALAPGLVTGLIGANGAGKTTMLNLMAGALRVSGGRVYLHGRDVTRASAASRARHGLARTFQHPRLVANLSCLENVMLGARPSRPIDSTGIKHRSRQRELADWSAEKLASTGLAEQHWLALPAQVPSQQHRWVEIARALAAQPSVFLLDEPNSGFSQAESQRLAELLTRLGHESGMAVLLVTHDVSLAARVCSRIAVMDHGQLIAWDTPHVIMSSSRVVSAYLGEKGRQAAMSALEGTS